MFAQSSLTSTPAGFASSEKKSTCLKHLKLFGYVKDQGPARTEQITWSSIAWGSMAAVEEKLLFQRVPGCGVWDSEAPVRRFYYPALLTLLAQISLIFFDAAMRP